MKFTLKLLIFSNQEMFGSAPIYDVPTSSTRLFYIPWYKKEISRTVENLRKTISGMQENNGLESKKISNDLELIQSDPTSCPQNQKGNN